MSFSNGLYAGMALGDRIKDNLGRRKREDAARADAAGKENMAFSAMSPEQRQTYLEGQSFADGSPEADLRLKRQRMVEAQIEEARAAKAAEVERSLEVDRAARQARLDGVARDLTERFAKMSPQQQADFHAQEQAPVGIGVLRPEARTPEMRGFISRGQVAQAGLQREADAAQQARLDKAVGQFVQGRRSAVAGEPTATVQYGPDGSVQRQWVRGGAPVATSAAPMGQPSQQAAAPAAPGGGVPEITGQDEFDRLPAGAPFVFRGQRGVKR